MNGPSFLYNPEESWPDKQFQVTGEAASEMKKTAVYAIALILTEKFDEILDPKRYSKWNRLITVNAWVNRFLNNYRRPKHLRSQGNFRVDELQGSEYEFISKAKKESFEEEYERLVKGKILPPSGKIIALKPQLDEDGLMRSCGRLQNVFTI